MADTATPDKSTSVNDLVGNMANRVENTYNDMANTEEEENINENIYSRQMMDDVNEPVNAPRRHMTHNNSVQKRSKPSWIETLKPPLIVMVLFIILNLEFCRNMFGSMMSKVVGTESSMLPLLALVLRSVFAAVIFSLLNRFL